MCSRTHWHTGHHCKSLVSAPLLVSSYDDDDTREDRRSAVGDLHDGILQCDLQVQMSVVAEGTLLMSIGGGQRLVLSCVAGGRPSRWRASAVAERFANC